MAVLNRLLAVVLGAAVAGLGVLLIVEPIMSLVGQRPLVVAPDTITSRLDDLTWDASLVTTTALILLAIGVVLLLPQMVSRPPEELPLLGEADRTAAIDRRALAGRLVHLAREDRAVLSAKASVSAKRARLSVKAQPGADEGPLRGRLESAVGDALESYEVAGPLTYKVVVSRSRERQA